MSSSPFRREDASRFAAILARAAEELDHLAPEKTPDAADVIDRDRNARQVPGLGQVSREAARVERESEPEPARRRERTSTRRCSQPASTVTMPRLATTPGPSSWRRAHPESCRCKAWPWAAPSRREAHPGESVLERVCDGGRRWRSGGSRRWDSGRPSRQGNGRPVRRVSSLASPCREPTATIQCGVSFRPCRRGARTPWLSPKRGVWALL